MKNHSSVAFGFAITMSIAPITGLAGPFDGLRQVFDPQSQCMPEVKDVLKTHMERKLQATKISEQVSVESFCASIRVGVTESQLKCYATCEADLAQQFNAKKAAQLLDEQERLDKAKQAREAELAKQQQEDQRQADLKAGRTQPTSLEDAAIAFGASPGDSIVKSPKLKPDGALYYLYGKIKEADARPTFYAVPTMSKQAQFDLAVYNLRGVGRPFHVQESTDYFKANVPKQMQAYYFDNARIEGGFDLIGRYVSNTRYRTLAGQEKTAPVFEVVYFRAW